MTSALAQLQERCRRVLPALISALHASPVEPLAGPWPLVTTGIGGSEGPARLLASLLQERGLAARFVPLSAFLRRTPPGRFLVIFSHNLSPNARLALAHHERFERVLLVTGLDVGHPMLAPMVGRRLSVLTLPAEDENGLLVRLVGPALAFLAAMQLAGIPSPPVDRIVTALEAAAEGTRTCGPLPPGPLAMVSCSTYTERCEGLRWRLLEGLLVPDLPLWDALSVAHGPFQGLHGRQQTILFLATLGSTLLEEALAAMLVPGRHSLIQLSSTLEEPWCLLEHLLQVDAWMLATLEAEPRPLSPWPGQGEDGPLYEVGRHPIR
ncbi:MAG: hypothetical protein RMJ98_09750 [Myxococcales bacterium]|nr:hypothetical protein [Polyangiaceae bacterium]MDW8249572.1 hypothetical protein [Myxococcales bacterium]